MLHEVGHGLYEQGLDPQHYGTPMGEATSVGMDESQARLWENRVGRSRGFWEHFLPQARERFPEALGDVDLDEFYFAVNRVTPSLIRVHADEVTYNVHVMIRFELERALMSGDLRGVGAARRVERRLPPVPRRDAGERCRGLSPGRSLGGGADRVFPDLHAGRRVRRAALRPGASRSSAIWRRASRGGSFASWCAGWGSGSTGRAARYPSARLIEVVTGAPPDHRPLVRGAARRYGALYDL